MTSADAKMNSRKLETALQSFYHRLLQPLSLFPRRVTPAEKDRLQKVQMLQALPSTRLTVESLCRLVTERLARSGLAAQVLPEGRLRLTEVILNELKCSWQEPPAEPSLSHQDNQKLRERLEAHVLLSSEQLFLRYLHLLVTLSAPTGVFTEPATIIRLAASLAKDCALFLTGPDVYRSLLADFRTLLKVDGAHNRVKTSHLSSMRAFKLCPIPWPHSIGFAQVPCSSINLNYLIHLSRPSEFLGEPGADPLKELTAIPQLKKKKTLLWPPSPLKKTNLNQVPSQIEPLPSSTVAPTSQTAPTTQFPSHSQLPRSQSMPSLREGWKLADELGLLPLPPRTLTPLVLVAESKPELAGDAVAEDLKTMMKKLKLEWPHYLSLDSDLPPLLGALTRHPTAGHRLRELQRMLKALEEEETFHQQDHHPPETSPHHPQPVTVTLKLRNQLVVETAAVRISDRNFVDSFYVEGAGVLYNHLSGELEPKLMEEMDCKHSVGSSSREIYKELMSCVSKSHFRFDQGPLIEPVADTDWSAFLSSALLRQEKLRHIINPELANPSSQGASTLPFNPNKASSLTSLHVKKSWDQRSTKASWWKTNLSEEDYFKYLTTQETDFLHVIFQMYEEAVPVEPVAPVKEVLELRHPPPLLEEEEPWDFVPDEWNCNVVLQHGLGTTELNFLGECHKIPSLQNRMERLWSMLEVPYKDRLDMVIKYSSNARLRQLPALLSAWEQALQPIQLREILLGKLEWFERQASNPNRFFQKPDRSPCCLLEENQIRNRLQRKLNQVEASLACLLGEIESIFDEPVTFKGRRYLDKMKHDKVEMLYWLQQRRRVGHLVRAQRAFHSQTAQSGKFSSLHLVAPGNTPITL
ncbi:PREDICTED: coiled-coil domain-containing protein 87 [Chrysochloris asiatica]|uniref:Coiled-coil domain-containing protein 87 n=1 Tax=Chrysochloris asiatica TaxID=185453 RepID=A0A9B0T8W4_CHRAS|nr:PREDICTED: coiled-coil domain-containing protein 87 [Chrysochloris asiatica]